MTPARIRGVPVDPLADLALPGTLLLACAVAIGAVASALRGLHAPPVPWLGALLFALESYLFTTIFVVREIDPPRVLRWVEVILMALAARWVGAVAVTGGWVAALTGGMDDLTTWLWVAVLAWAWYQGLRTATLVGPLHPGLHPIAPAPERLKHNDHLEAYEAIRTLLLAQLTVTAVTVGLAGQVRAVQGWSGPAAAVFVLALLTVLAVLIAAQLRQRFTWAQEGLTPPPAVRDRWLSRAVGVLVLPLLLATVLPAGPRLPAERLLALLNRQPTVTQPLPVQPQQEQRPDDMGQLPQALRDRLGSQVPWPAWVRQTAITAAILAGALIALSLLYTAARQLAERAGREDLRGLAALLTALAAWYAALWQALLQVTGGAVIQVLRGPAEALVAAMAGAGGALARHLPLSRRAPADPRAAVRHFFGRLQADAARRGIRRAPGDTAQEFGTRLRTMAPSQADAVYQFTQAYNIARYSDQGVGPEAVSVARRAWVAITRALSRPQKQAAGPQGPAAPPDHQNSL